MAPSVSTPESFLTSFPQQLPKIEGEPTYESLSLARDILKGNATSVDSNRGGGDDGYLALIVTDAQYLAIAEEPFILPKKPGAQPEIPAGTSVADTKVLVRAWEESVREWQEYTNITLALKKQLTESMNSMYLGLSLTLSMLEP